MKKVQNFIHRRGWSLKITTPETLEHDLSCGSVLWYLSDWNPPQDFGTKYVPLIMNFVREGGGLLIGGLGWSYHQLYKGLDTIYSADVLGKPFGLSFTLDVFDFNPADPIRLLQGDERNLDDQILCQGSTIRSRELLFSKVSYRFDRAGI
ncbi:MAG: hypothetical protein IPJ09_07340 [Saprospiraceae bacterium]|nr:hypothetical protein [Saprospiraceae bacterium]